jgi:FkbM family methyltransferase
MLTGRAGAALKRAGRWPFNAVGLDVVRKGQQKRASKRVFPAWDDRLQHARDLGFAPKVIFDGGAFRGYWSRDVARLFPGAQLVMIEPNPHLREIIATTVAAVEPPPIMVDVALGDAPGSAALHIWRASDADRGASLLDNVSGEAKLTVDVEVRTLDMVCDDLGLVPDLLKLDLQGGELAALQGATQALRHTELMLIEFGCLDAYVGRTTPRDLLDIMFDHDFCLYDLVDGHYRPYDGALTGGDFIFVKNGSALRAYKGWE